MNRLVAGEEVVTHVTVTDGQRSDEAISFFTVHNGKIANLVEFWPEKYPAPSSRAHLTEPLGRGVRV